MYVCMYVCTCVHVYVWFRSTCMLLLLLQLSYGSSANNLGDRSRYLNHFQLHPTEANYLPAIVATIAYYGWSQVGIITQNENIFTGVW